MPCYGWSDSEVVLSWIHSHPSHFKIFVSNRISEIQNLTSVACWRHCWSEGNPADVVSRGCDPDFLMKGDWFKGPHWLLSRDDEWNSVQFPINKFSLSEKVSMGVIQVIDTSRWSWLKE